MMLGLEGINELEVGQTWIVISGMLVVAGRRYVYKIMRGIGQTELFFFTEAGEHLAHLPGVVVGGRYDSDI